MKKLYCQREGCGKQIDPIKVWKGGAKREPQFCLRECALADRKSTGYYQELSRIGNQAQANIKAATGKAPGVRGGARTRKQ